MLQVINFKFELFWYFSDTNAVFNCYLVIYCYLKMSDLSLRRPSGGLKTPAIAELVTSSAYELTFTYIRIFLI